MNGYQPKKRCVDCLEFGTCKKKTKNKVCEKYEGCKPAPPTSGSNAQTPKYTPPPMPEVKPPKQRTVLSVRDFAILYGIVNRELARIEWSVAHAVIGREQAEYNPEYQDLLRIREKLGELNIEMETPRVEVK